MSEDVWQEFDKMVSGDDQPEQSQPYSIECGGRDDTDESPEAQGRRAWKHVRRIRRYRDVRRTQQAMIDMQIEELEEDLQKARLRKKLCGEWFEKRTQWDRFLLYEWQASELFRGMKQKSHALADGFTIGSRTSPERTAIVVLDEERLQDILPHSCFSPRKKEVNSRLLVHGGTVVVKSTGEAVPSDVAGIETTPEREVRFLHDDETGETIILEGVISDGGGTDADDSTGTDEDASPEAP